MWLRTLSLLANKVTQLPARNSEMPRGFANLRRKQNAAVFSQVASCSTDRDNRQHHQSRKDVKHILMNSNRICCQRNRHETLGGTETRSFWAVPLHRRPSQKWNKNVAFQRTNYFTQVQVNCFVMLGLTRASTLEDTLLPRFLWFFTLPGAVIESEGWSIGKMTRNTCGNQLPRTWSLGNHILNLGGKE